MSAAIAPFISGDAIENCTKSISPYSLLGSILPELTHPIKEVILSTSSLFYKENLINHYEGSTIGEWRDETLNPIIRYSQGTTPSKGYHYSDTITLRPTHSAYKISTTPQVSIKHVNKRVINIHWDTLSVIPVREFRVSKTESRE